MTTCAVPNVPPAAVRFQRPQLPAARLDGRRPAGTVYIALSIDATGAIVAADVRNGDAPLRETALATARDGTYRAEVRSCVPVAGTYLMTVDYQRPPLHACPPPTAEPQADGDPLPSIACVAATVGEP